MAPGENPVPKTAVPELSQRPADREAAQRKYEKLQKPEPPDTVESLLAGMDERLLQDVFTVMQEDALRDNDLFTKVKNALEKKVLVKTAEKKNEIVHAPADPIGELLQLDSKIAPLEEGSAVALVRKLMPMQFDVAEGIGATSPSEFEAEAANIVAIAVRNRTGIRMRLFLDCMDSGPDEAKSYEKLLTLLYPGEPLTPQRLNGAKFLVRYLKKYRAKMEEHAKAAGVNLPDITLDQALSTISQNDKIATLLLDMKVRLGDSFDRDKAGKSPDVDLSFLRESFKDKKAFPGHVVGAAFYPLSGKEGTIDGLNATDRAHFLRDTQLVTEFFTTKNASDIEISQINQPTIFGEWMEGDKPRPQFKVPYDMCHKLVKEVQFGAMKEELLKALMIPGEKDRSGEEKAIAAKIEELVTGGKLHLDDAYQLYLLKQSGNSLLFLYKSIDLLKRYATPGTMEVTYAQGRYMQVANTLSSMALEGLSIEEFAARLNVSTEVATEMRNAGLYIKESAGNVLWEELLKAYAFAKNNPLLAAIFWGLPTAGVAYWSLKQFAKFVYFNEKEWTKANEFLSDYDNLSDAEFQNKYKQSKSDAKPATEELGRLNTRRSSLDRFWKFYKFGEKKRIAKAAESIVDRLAEAAPDAAPKSSVSRRAGANYKAGTGAKPNLTPAQTGVENPASLADLHKIAADLQISIDGKTEAQIRSEVEAHPGFRGRK